MTSLLGARKRAEEFSAAVEGRTAASTLRPELAELVGIVSALREHEAPAPRPEFSAELRERLLAEAEATLATDKVLRLPPRRSGTRERRLALVASSVVLVGGTAGMAAASQDALPGDALYPIKRGIERVQADLGTSSTSKGRELLSQADNRLVEVQGLMSEPDGSAHVPATIERFTAQAVEGSDLLLESFEESQDPAVIEELRGFTAEALPVLQELAKVAPPEFQDELARAAAALTEIDQRASEACTACLPELPALRMPEMFLTATEVARAMEAMQRTSAGNSHPALPGSPAEKPGKGAKRGTAEPVDGQSQQPGPPGLPGVPQGVDTKTPPRLDDVVDGVRGATGGLLDDVDKTVDELLPDELDPLTDPLKGTLKDPVKGLTDPLKGVTDPLKGGLEDPLGP